MRHVLIVVVALAVIVAGASFAAPARGVTPAKVAIIVGPVGEELTPTYIGLAEAAATQAEIRGATVARAYSPNANAELVIAAVADANVVVYLGHGVGTPNPYSANPNPATTNGWGLNGPNAVGTHADSWQDGTLSYYGESWLTEHLEPAPGWVMIYSNACYAPGASEGAGPAADQPVAANRVSAYSRGPLADLSASAFFATDFYEGAAHLVATLFDHPELPYGGVFATEPRFVQDAVTALPHGLVEGAEVRLHRSAYFNGKVDYWYAFAGNPSATFAENSEGAAASPAAGAPSPVPRTASAPAPDIPPLTAVDGVVTGVASSYPENVGWEGRATIALPVAIGGRMPAGEPTYVVVCADRCATLPVVDSCPCYVGTAEQRVANLSHAAWALVSDAPLAKGLIRVKVQMPSTPGAVSPGSLGDDQLTAAATHGATATGFGMRRDLYPGWRH